MLSALFTFCHKSDQNGMYARSDVHMERTLTLWSPVDRVAYLKNKISAQQPDGGRGRAKARAKRRALDALIFLVRK